MAPRSESEATSTELLSLQSDWSALSDLFYLFLLISQHQCGKLKTLTDHHQKKPNINTGIEARLRLPHASHCLTTQPDLTEGSFCNVRNIFLELKKATIEF